MFFGWAAERIALLSTEVRKTANNYLKCKFNELFPVMLLNIVMYPTFLFKFHPPEVLAIVVSWVSYFNLWLLHLPHQHFFLYWFLHVHMSPRLFFLSCSLIIYSCHKSYIYVHPSEKALAPHSSTLAWKIPWMEEPGGLQSMGSLRVGHDWVTSLSLFTFHFHALEKEMATHSSVLAWRISGMGEPGELQSMGSHRVGHDWSNLAAAAATSILSPLSFTKYLSVIYILKPSLTRSSPNCSIPLHKISNSISKNLAT